MRKKPVYADVEKNKVQDVKVKDKSGYRLKNKISRRKKKKVIRKIIIITAAIGHDHSPWCFLGMLELFG